MLDIENIEDTIYTWISTVSGWTTIFAHQNSPRPDLPYVLVNVLRSNKIGTEENKMTLLVDDSADVDYSTTEDIFVSINTYGTDAFEMATKLKDSLNRITINEQLFSGGLGFREAKTVNEMMQVIIEQWEERAQFDCFFYARSLDEENIETIRKIELTNDIDSTTTVIE